MGFGLDLSDFLHATWEKSRVSIAEELKRLRYDLSRQSQKFLVGPILVDNLPSAASIGTITTVKDSKTNVWGDTVLGDGSYLVLVMYTGVDWIIIGTGTAPAAGSNGISQLTGDVTAGPGTGSQAATLSNTGVTASTYGDSSHVAQITVDAKGRLSTVTNIAIPAGYTDEQAEDAVGGILTDTATIDFTYNDGANTITADIKTGSVTEAMQVLADNTTQDVTSTKHGYVPKSAADAAKFLNGAATPVFAAVKDSDLSTTDITTNDVTTSKHGFTPKAPNDTTKFLRGDATWAAPASAKYTVGIVVDGAGAVLTTGVKGFTIVPTTGTITKVTLLSSDAAVTSGSIVFDIWKDTYANYSPTVADTITAAAKPTLSSATKYQDSTLTGWTTSVTAGDTFGFKIDSVTTITRATLVVEITP